MLKSEAAIQAGDQASMQSVRPARPAGNSTLNQQITFLCHFWPLASVKWRYIAINRGLLGGCRVVDVQESAVHSPRLKQHAQQPLHQGIGRCRCQQQRRDGCQRGQGHHHHRLPRDRERAHVFYHSHPKDPARPSHTDIKIATDYEEIWERINLPVPAYLLVSLMHSPAADIRTYWITDGKVRPADVHIL